MSTLTKDAILQSLIKSWVDEGRFEAEWDGNRYRIHGEEFSKFINHPDNRDCYLQVKSLLDDGTEH